MELESGFKQTELGAIPEDWKVGLISDLATVVRGSSPRPAGNPRYFNGTFIPWLTVADLTNIPPSQTLVCKTLTALTEEGSKQSRILSPNTLIIANSGATLGIAKILNITCCANDGIAALFDLDANTSPKYLAYYLNTQTTNLRQVVATGNGQPNLNTGLIGNIQVPLPPTKYEQEAIAEALSDVDELIESLEQLIAKKRLIKQGALSSLFSGQSRLPGFTDKWNLMKIGEFTDCVAGGTPSTKIQEYWDGDIPWMSSGELNQKNIHEVEGRITELGLRNSSTLLLPVGCTLIGLAGQGKTRGTVAVNHIPLCTNQSIAAIFPNSSFDPYFLFYNLELRYEELRELSAGDGGRGGLNLTIIRNIQIPFPSIVEQKAIAAALFDMDREITEIRNNIDKARSVKLGMMQQLLTGKIRLVSPQVKILSSIKKEAHTVKANSHSIEFEDAVIIAVLAACFASAQWPLSRFRYTKFSYLLRRRSNKSVDSYLKKAAGPYNPRTRYGGPERITVQKGYSQKHSNGTYSGFLAGEKIEEAEKYFETWFGKESLTWLKQFQFDKHDQLELLTTVDMAMVNLRDANKEIELETVKQLIYEEPEWAPKLDRSIFSDDNIQKAMKRSLSLFGQV